jgi:hypothetical protein
MAIMAGMLSTGRCVSEDRPAVNWSRRGQDVVKSAAAAVIGVLPLPGARRVLEGTSEQA